VAATDNRCCVLTRIGRAQETGQEIAPVIVRGRVTDPVVAIAPALRTAPRVVATEPREAVIARRPPTVAVLVQAIALLRPIAVTGATVEAP
jgi:hypothetical protein